MTAWIDELLDYCGRHRLWVDFISTQIYPTEPLGFEGADTNEPLANRRRKLLRGGFGLLDLHGVAKPVPRAFHLLHGPGTTGRCAFRAPGGASPGSTRGSAPGLDPHRA